MFCISSLLLFSPHPLYINSSAPLTVLLHPLPFIPTTPCSARLMISCSLRKPTPPFTYRVPFLSLLFSDPIYTTPCTLCHLLFSSSPSSPTPSITIPSHTSTDLHPPVNPSLPFHLLTRFPLLSTSTPPTATHFYPPLSHLPLLYFTLPVPFCVSLPIPLYSHISHTSSSSPFSSILSAHPIPSLSFLLSSLSLLQPSCLYSPLSYFSFSFPTYATTS